MRSILFLLILASMASCVSTSKMARQLNSKKVTLGFIHDSKVYGREKTSVVSISDPISAVTLPAKPDVYRLKASVIPLLVYNSWGEVLECNMGASQLDSEPAKFIRDALARELHRSTGIAVEPASDVELRMEIRQLSVKGPYTTKAFVACFVFVAFWGAEQHVGPSTAKCEIKYTLVKNGTTLFEKSIITSSTLEPLAINHGDYKMLRQTYSVIMGEQLSNAIKDNIEQAAHQIENALSGI